MKSFFRLVVGFLLAAMMPLAAHAADDPFIGTWQLDVERSIIGENPGIKKKQFVFAPSADGVLITETLELLSALGEQQVAQIPYTYGEATPQPTPGMDSLLVVKADDHTAYWTAVEGGAVIAQMQVVVSNDDTQMTFRYLYNASDPTGSQFDDRYVYVQQ